MASRQLRIHAERCAIASGMPAGHPIGRSPAAPKIPDRVKLRVPVAIGAQAKLAVSRAGAPQQGELLAVALFSGWVRRIEDGADTAGAGVRVGGLCCGQQVAQCCPGLGQFG